MALKGKDFVSALLKKGFVKDPNAGRSGRKRRPHVFYYFYYNGKQTSVKTHVSYSEKEYCDGVIKNFRHDMRISKKQLMDFVNCSLGEEEYAKILISNKDIEP